MNNDEETSPHDVITSDVLVVVEHIETSDNECVATAAETSNTISTDVNNVNLEQVAAQDNNTTDNECSKTATTIPQITEVAGEVVCDVTNNITENVLHNTIEEEVIEKNANNNMPTINHSSTESTIAVDKNVDKGKIFGRFNSAGKLYRSERRVSFPENDSELVTGYLEPANPWAQGIICY